MLKKNAMALGMLALSCIISGPVIAETSPGFYVGAGVGQINLQEDSVGFDADDTAFKIFGGYSVNKNLSIEAAYYDGGSPSQTIQGLNVKAKVSGFDGSLVGSLPINPQFSLFARLGVIFWDEKVSTVFGFAKDSGNDLSYGVGAALRANDHAQVRLEWQSANTELDARLLMVSAIWKFQN